MEQKYPHIKVQLTGEDGSAPAIIARCRRAAQRAGLSVFERGRFMKEAYSGDYGNVVRTAMDWFDCQ